MCDINKSELYETCYERLMYIYNNVPYYGVQLSEEKYTQLMNATTN